MHRVGCSEKGTQTKKSGTSLFLLVLTFAHYYLFYIFDYCIFGLKSRFPGLRTRPRGGFWGAESEFSVQNDEK